MLIDGAHHSRELISYEMVMLALFEVLRGYLQNDGIWSEIIKKGEFL